VVTFASPTAVIHLPDALTRAVFERIEAGLKTRSVAACIGPVTEEAARRHGYRVAIIANTHTAAGLVAAVVRHFAKEG
jgi:uroporphyrinogen-III synthase